MTIRVRWPRTPGASRGKNTEKAGESHWKYRKTRAAIVPDVEKHVLQRTNIPFHSVTKLSTTVRPFAISYKNSSQGMSWFTHFWTSFSWDGIGSSHGACFSFSELTAPDGDPKHTIPFLVHKVPWSTSGFCLELPYYTPGGWHSWCIAYHTTMIALGGLQNIAAFLLCLALLTVIFLYITRPSGLPLPPGPFKDNFLLGNSIPTSLYGL